MKLINADIHFDIFENFTGDSNRDYFESKVNGVLNQSIDETGRFGSSETTTEQSRVCHDQFWIQRENDQYFSNCSVFRSTKCRWKTNTLWI